MILKIWKKQIIIVLPSYFLLFFFMSKRLVFSVSRVLLLLKNIALAPVIKDAFQN